MVTSALMSIMVSGALIRMVTCCNTGLFMVMLLRLLSTFHLRMLFGEKAHAGASLAKDEAASMCRGGGAC